MQIPETLELVQVEELEELTVRVVNRSVVGAARARPAPSAPTSHGAARPLPTAPAPSAKPAVQAPTSSPPAPTKPAIQAPPSPPPAAAKPAARAPAAAPQPAAKPAPQAPASAPPAPAGAALPAPAYAPPKTDAPVKGMLNFDRVFFALAVLLLLAGFRLPIERYITPTRGVGYWLGIVGGSLMLLLLVYSVRKRVSWLSWMGSTPAWFRFHMVLGVAGPLCILYHSNFGTGATNSNVALFAMLTVAGSGFVGRYFYSHVHYGLYGRKLEFSELRSGADKLRGLSGLMSFLPDLIGRIEVAEQRLLNTGPQAAMLGFLKPLVVAVAAAKERWQLHSYLRQALKANARLSKSAAAQRGQLTHAALMYIDRRLEATKRLAEFSGYERLFSLWHSLHIPLIFALAIAAVIHVIAVNVY